MKIVPSSFTAMTELQIPRVGCGAVVRDADGRILLIQRGRDPERGHWGLPGGKVDWMETVEAAVVREVREETALEVQLLRLLCVADHFEPALAQHWVAPIYEARATTCTEASIQEPGVQTGLGWFAVDSLPQPLTQATVQALARL
jgi:ADP-ribose pyrophosphatase YjhB (NUDIX family)